MPQKKMNRKADVMNHCTTTNSQENAVGSNPNIITRFDFDHYKKDQESNEDDALMPGFRFHPTEEELIEFYLRRKVEGKRFNFELIAFLDLYRYDPWELPALAAMGEKEWYFYVPRDRKYRNGDRPNRVTASGYWKATGADQTIKSEGSSRPIGLKKTLVFYSGKAPKGIRSTWTMNEYRLPHQETERLQKAEISLCRVYKRAGVEDHRSISRKSRQSLQQQKQANPNEQLFQFDFIEKALQQKEEDDLLTTKSTTIQSITSNDDDIIGMTSLAITQQSSLFPIDHSIPIMASANPRSGRIDADDLHKIVNNSNNDNRYSLQQASLLSTPLPYSGMLMWDSSIAMSAEASEDYYYSHGF